MSRSTEPTTIRRKACFPRFNANGQVQNTRVYFSLPFDRVGIRIFPRDPLRSFIIQFISQWQAEIIKEMIKLFSLLFEDKKK